MVTIFKKERSIIPQNDFNNMTVPRLDDLVVYWNIKNVIGTGKNGKILKANLVKSINDYVNNTNTPKSLMLYKLVSWRTKLISNHSAPHWTESCYGGISLTEIKLRGAERYMIYDSNQYFEYHLSNSTWTSSTDKWRANSNELNKIRQCFTYLRIRNLWYKLTYLCRNCNVVDDIKRYMLSTYLLYERVDITNIRILNYL